MFSVPPALFVQMKGLTEWALYWMRDKTIVWMELL